jgi:glycosyltransferase involved in cell wall biosynthesis
MMTDIEIILVNDFSTDNSSQIIEEMQKEDPRIRIINNKKNMGILYSRCIAVLEAKGRYILNLDQDDFFFDENLFDSLYEEIEEKNFDIVSFMDLEIRDYNVSIKKMKDGPCTHHPDNLIVRQPELPYYPMFYKEHFAYVDVQIWGKIFKTEVYQKAVNLLGKKRYSVYNAINEDIIGVFSICIVSQTYKYMRRYGLFHLVGHPTAVHRAPRQHTAKMAIFFSDIIYDLSKNEYKKYAAIMILGLRTFNDEIKEYLRHVLKKIMNSEYIEEKYKEKIREEYGNLGVLN